MALDSESYYFFDNYFLAGLTRNKVFEVEAVMGPTHYLFSEIF